jgi:hypothetical protein
MGKRGTVQILVWLTILAWATQTLFHQWGFGAPAPATPEQMSPEQFVPSLGKPGSGGTLELRTEASVYGPEVRLKQVCRWSEADGAMFGPIADLILARLSDSSPFRSLSVQDVKNTLRDAGVNLGVIRFCGATACTVSRTDARYDEGAALQQWIDAANDSKTTRAGAGDDALDAGRGGSAGQVRAGSAVPVVAADSGDGFGAAAGFAGRFVAGGLQSQG